MANWKYTLNIANIWRDDNLTVAERGERVAARIRATFPAAWFNAEGGDFDDIIADIAERFEMIGHFSPAADELDNIEEFDDIMSDLYDWGDQEVEPFCRRDTPDRRNKMCWVETRRAANEVTHDQ